MWRNPIVTVNSFHVQYEITNELQRLETNVWKHVAQQINYFIMNHYNGNRPIKAERVNDLTLNTQASGSPLTQLLRVWHLMLIIIIILHLSWSAVHRTQRHFTEKAKNNRNKKFEMRLIQTYRLSSWKASFLTSPTFTLQQIYCISWRYHCHQSCSISISYIIYTICYTCSSSCKNDLRVKKLWSF